MEIEPPWSIVVALVLALLVVTLALFALTIGGQTTAEYEQANEEMVTGGEPVVQWPESVHALAAVAVAWVVLRVRRGAQ